jgi:ECF sigma factor
LDLSSDGYSERRTAQRLKISQSTINRDLAYLREKAKENIRHYIDERLPLEYQKCLIGLNGILSRMSDIMDNADASDRDIMQATF